MEGSGTVVSIAGKACLRQGYFSTASTDALSSLRDVSDLLESCSAAGDIDNELCVGGNCSRSPEIFSVLKEVQYIWIFSRTTVTTVPQRC